MADYCENFKALISAKDAEAGTHLLARTRCKMWTCEYCANRNRKIWQARIISHINNHNDLRWSWFTLTAHSKKRGAKNTIKNLRGAWDRLIKRIKRHFPDVPKIHYLRVYEQHKDLSYHLHCIISVHWNDLKIRKSKSGKETSHSLWLDAQCVSLKIGYYSHAANFVGKHAGYIAGYVTKYMTKMSISFKSELGRIRHIQPSQAWQKAENQSKLEWRMIGAYYENNLIEDIKTKTTTIDVNTGEIINHDAFITTYVYPPEFDHRKPD